MGVVERHRLNDAAERAAAAAADRARALPRARADNRGRTRGKITMASLRRFLNPLRGPL